MNAVVVASVKKILPHFPTYCPIFTVGFRQNFRLVIRPIVKSCDACHNRTVIAGTAIFSLLAPWRSWITVILWFRGCCSLWNTFNSRVSLKEILLFATYQRIDDPAKIWTQDERNGRLAIIVNFQNFLNFELFHLITSDFSKFRWILQLRGCKLK